jgi:hypothetical protein
MEPVRRGVRNPRRGLGVEEMNQRTPEGHGRPPHPSR